MRTIVRFSNLHLEFYIFRRWINITFFGWKDAVKNPPKTNEIVIVKGCSKLAKTLAVYRLPPDFPDFAKTEEDKREWYAFQRIDNSISYAGPTLWKPYYGAIAHTYDPWDMVKI